MKSVLLQEGTTAGSLLPAEDGGAKPKFKRGGGGRGSRGGRSGGRGLARGDAATLCSLFHVRGGERVPGAVAPLDTCRVAAAGPILDVSKEFLSIGRGSGSLDT
jgi:hypothetical protein